MGPHLQLVTGPISSHLQNKKLGFCCILTGAFVFPTSEEKWRRESYISLYQINPYFGSKRSCFWGLTCKNRAGHLGSRDIYIFIYIYIYILYSHVMSCVRENGFILVQRQQQVSFSKILRPRNVSRFCLVDVHIPAFGRVATPHLNDFPS